MDYRGGGVEKKKDENGNVSSSVPLWVVIEVQCDQLALSIVLFFLVSFTIEFSLQKRRKLNSSCRCTSVAIPEGECDYKER